MCAKRRAIVNIFLGMSVFAMICGCLATQGPGDTTVGGPPAQGVHADKQSILKMQPFGSIIELTASEKTLMS